MSSVAERVVAVTARVLNVVPENIEPKHNFSADLGAESVQSIELVAMFEEEFGIDMEEDTALAVETVGDATDYITKVCQEQGVQV